MPTWEEYTSAANSGPMLLSEQAFEAFGRQDAATLAEIARLGQGLECSTHRTTGVDGNEIVRS